MLLRWAACFALVQWAALALTDRALADYDWPMRPAGAYHQRHPNDQPGNPNYPLPPGNTTRQGTAGTYPWYGTVWGVPAYNWGYFGAPSYPTSRWHEGYSRDFYQWGQWRRY